MRRFTQPLYSRTMFKIIPQIFEPINTKINFMTMTRYNLQSPDPLNLLVPLSIFASKIKFRKGKKL